MCFWVVLSCSVFIQKPKKPINLKTFFLNLGFSSPEQDPNAGTKTRFHDLTSFADYILALLTPTSYSGERLCNGTMSVRCLSVCPVDR